MITPLLLTIVLAASPSEAAELAAALAAEDAIVHHVADVVPLGGQEILDMIEEGERFLKSKNPIVRRAGCMVLKHFGNVEHHGAMITVALRDPIDRVSAQASVALASWSDERSIGPLMQAFQRDGSDTKIGCLVAFEEIADRTGTPKARAALERLLRWTKNPNDQLRIRQTLERMEETE